MKRPAPPLLFLALGIAATGAAAQSEEAGAASAMGRVLAVLGLSCGQLVAMGLGMVVLHWLAVHFGARFAGLLGSLGRAFLVLLLAGAIMIPVGLGLLLVLVRLGPTAQNVVSQLAGAGAEVLAIKLLYQTGFGRALFGYLAASLMTLVGSAVLLVLLF